MMHSISRYSMAERVTELPRYETWSTDDFICSEIDGFYEIVPAVLRENKITGRT